MHNLSHNIESRKHGALTCTATLYFSQPFLLTVGHRLGKSNAMSGALVENIAPRSRMMTCSSCC